MTLSAQGFQFGLSLVSTVILARLLQPEDFGLVAMVASITGFVSLFKDMGLSMATVQRSKITHEQVSTLFWINLAISSLMACIIMSLAIPIGWFYQEPRLKGITLCLAIGMPLSGLAIQHQALLRRQMQFKQLAMIRMAGQIISIAIGIGLAWLGAGYWSLVAMPIMTSLIAFVGVWAACTWVPGPPVRGSGVKSMLGFGGYLTSFHLINYFTRHLDNILIGYAWGASPLGLYNRAYGLLLLPIRQINAPVSAVAIPVLSRLTDSPERYRAYYRLGIMLMVSVGMPIVGLFFVAADGLIPLVLGPQWNDAVPIFKALTPAAFIGTFNVATGWVCIPFNRVNRQLTISVVNAVVVIISFLIGLRWGALGVAAAFSVAQCLMRFPSVAYCFHGTPLHIRDLADALWRPALASLIAVIVTEVASQITGHNPLPWINLLRDLVVFLLIYILVWITLPGGKQAITRLKSLVSELTQKGRKTL